MSISCNRRRAWARQVTFLLVLKGPVWPTEEHLDALVLLCQLDDLDFVVLSLSIDH